MKNRRISPVEKKSLCGDGMAGSGPTIWKMSRFFAYRCAWWLVAVQIELIGGVVVEEVTALPCTFHRV